MASVGGCWEQRLRWKLGDGMLGRVQMGAATEEVVMYPGRRLPVSPEEPIAHVAGRCRPVKRRWNTPRQKLCVNDQLLFARSDTITA